MFGRSIKSVEKKVEKADRLIELAYEITELKIQKADLTIQIEAQAAAYQRGDLEIKHMIGLERKRQEVEIEQARREAVLAVKEENLKAKQDQFDISMKFREEQFKSEMNRMQGFLEEITKRLPMVNVNKTLRG